MKKTILTICLSLAGFGSVAGAHEAVAADKAVIAQGASPAYINEVVIITHPHRHRYYYNGVVYYHRSYYHHHYRYW